MIKEKVVLVTHNDLDGVGCQIILKSICTNFDITVINCNYDKVDRIVKNLVTGSEHYDRLFITDISVRDSSVVELINNTTCFSHVVLLDHHETVEELNSQSWATVKMVDENNKRVCGTTLLLDYIYNNITKDIFKQYRDFAEIVRKWDTWDWFEHRNEENGMIPKKLNDLFHIYGIEKFETSMIEKLTLGDSIFDETDKVILDIKQQEINNYINQKDCSFKKIVVDNHIVGVVFGEKYISELGNELSSRHQDCDYIAIINGSTVSLRTTHTNIHLGEIAKKYGGGGHKQAAGYCLPSSMDELLRFYFDNSIDNK